MTTLTEEHPGAAFQQRREAVDTALAGELERFIEQSMGLVPGTLFGTNVRELAKRFDACALFSEMLLDQRCGFGKTSLRFAATSLVEPLRLVFIRFHDNASKV